MVCAIKEILLVGILLLYPAFLYAADKPARPAHGKPNIILIMADDVSPDMFGCYGNKEAKTPHIDRMAKEGVMFRTAWSSSICGPARAMIMTGCYASTTGFWSNGFSLPQKDGSNNLFSFFTSFGKLMKDAGYATAVAGKWHVGGAQMPDDAVVGFDEYSLWENLKDVAQLSGNPKFTGAFEDDRTTSRYWHPCLIQNHHLLETKADDFGPALNTAFLCDFMERSVKADKPFLVYYPMVAPHGTREGSPTCPIYGEVGRMDKSDDSKQRFRALNDYIDILVGRLKQKAVDLGVMNNTIIILCSDNGTAVVAKSRGVERGCRVIFLVSGAGIKKRGATDEICDLSDVLPTLVDFGGAKLPENGVDGVSLKPFLTGKTDKHRDYIFSCIGTTRLVRNKTHMLEVVNPILGVPDGRFYFCGDSRDGRGYKRVDNSPEHATVRKEFSQILNDHPGLTLEHPYFQRKGASWLKDYMDPKSAEKHLHNHKDYQFYDEAI